MEQWLISILTVPNGAGAILIIIAWKWVDSKFKGIEQSIKEINAGKTWKETCATVHKEVDHRLERIENRLNGALKK